MPNPSTVKMNPVQRKRCFITGGAGFIANSLIRRLVPEYDVIVYDNFHRDTLSGSDLNGHPQVTVIRGDVLEFDSLVAAMEGCDSVIHAAGIAGIDTVIRRPVTTMRVNMIGTANVLEAARINSIPDRVIDFSTWRCLSRVGFYKVL